MRFGESGLKNKLQKKYKLNLDKSHMNKSDNNMHINVLFKKLLFNENNANFEIYKKWTINKLENMVNNYIEEILTRMRNEKIPKNWSKNIDEWFETLKSLDKNVGEYSLSSYSSEDFENIINNTLLQDKTKIIDYDSSISMSSWNHSNDFEDNKNLEKIGKIGEQIVFSLLIKKYGIGNVTWHSQIDKYAPYDIKYSYGNTTKYIEVKSSTRINRINWYISRREIEFYKKKKQDYEIYFVKDIHKVKNIDINKETDAGVLIQRIANPKIIIDQKLIGVKNKNELFITPIKYKGLA